MSRLNWKRAGATFISDVGIWATLPGLGGPTSPLGWLVERLRMKLAVDVVVHHPALSLRPLLQLRLAHVRRQKTPVARSHRRFCRHRVRGRGHSEGAPAVQCSSYS